MMKTKCLVVLGLTMGLGLGSIDIAKVCQDVRVADEKVYQQLLNPTIAGREKVFTDIRNYITALSPLYEALKAEKVTTLETCKDVLNLGTSRFMNIKYDYDHLVGGFNWTDDEMNIYRDLRGDTLTEWVKMEPYIFD